MTIDEVWDTDTVQDCITDLSREIGLNIARRHERMLCAMKSYSKAQSPIEAVFWIAWVTVEKVCQYEDQPVVCSLAPQFEVDVNGRTYRLDFAIPSAKVAVELDGHDFHERTKDQVAYRNQRDRDLQAYGWIVLHFSGTELLRNPPGIVSEVWSAISARMQQVSDVEYASAVGSN